VKALGPSAPDPAMPARATVFRWLANNQEFRQLYALARQCQAEDLADEILKIADDSSRDYADSIQRKLSDATRGNLLTLREVADEEVPANNVRGSLSGLCVEQARASQESIAGVLGVSQSTVSREMCRNRGQRGYRFKQAEAKAQARQAIRSRPRKLTAPSRRKIEAKLRPALVAGADQRLVIRTGHQAEP
jgi:predicted transcriptional regulator